MLRSPCPVACSLDIVGDRWTLLLIRDLLFGKSRYGDFLSSVEHIPTNILADRLKRLEREGLVTRIPYSSRPPRVEYHLTDEGRALAHTVDALAAWGTTHFPGTKRRLRSDNPESTAAAPAEPDAGPGSQPISRSNRETNPLPPGLPRGERRGRAR